MSGRGGGRGGRGRGGGRARGGGGGRDGGGGGRGRDGGRSGRSGRDGGGGRGRGGGRGGAPAHCPPSALSNVILTSVTAGFKFYQYGVDCKDKKGEQIDSRSRRTTLFYLGLFDPKVGWLARKMGMKEKEINELKRVVFFQNSTFFSARPVPGLDDCSSGIPLVGGGEGTPNSDNGDAMTIIGKSVFTAPTEMSPPTRAAPQAGPVSDVTASMSTVSLDRRCSNCTKSFTDDKALFAHCKETGHTPIGLDKKENSRPANQEEFIQYANLALKRALGERLAPWGREYIDPKNFTEPKDRNGKPMGVRVFKAYTCEFGLHKNIPDPSVPCQLGLTVDLKAKVMRTISVLEILCDGKNPSSVKYDKPTQDRMKRKWVGEVVIAVYDKKCYSVKNLIFDKSPASLPIPGQNMSHSEYFEKRKNIKLKYPNAAPMIEVMGRNDSSIFLPAEIVCANELDPFIKQKLPSIASFTPDVRNEAIDEIKRFLISGAQKTRGVGGDFLPALGFGLSGNRMKVAVTKLPLPMIVAAGVRVSENQGAMWAPMIAKANYKVNPKHAVQLQVVLIHSSYIKNWKKVYNSIANMVNNFSSTFCFPRDPFAVIDSGTTKEKHWGAIEKYFGGTKLPSNLFVVDLANPPRGQSNDPAYSVVKCMLGKGGFLSQFVNFATHDHGNARDERDAKKSNTILSGVARQILSKCGVRVWWVNIPRNIPLPSVLVGVDVFHAPRKYDPKTGKKGAKQSVAAIIVQIVNSHDPSSNSKVYIYCETECRSAGKEMELGSIMEQTVANALKAYKVSPQSCFIWRDGVADNSIDQVSKQEIPAVRRALANRGRVVGAGAKAAGPNVPLAYIVCQKRISTKFLTADGQALPCGAMVKDLQGPKYKTFYINGTSPPYSTPKPARFILAERDPPLNAVSPSELAWALCHDYPNWTGPIKLPAPVQMAHKLAELAGGMDDCGESIDHQRYAGKIYFL